MTTSLSAIRAALRRQADPARAEVLRGFFKTRPGEYGEGDKFLGLTMPALRELGRTHERASLAVVTKLLGSPWHEERMLALLILVRRYTHGTDADRRRIAALYLAHRQGVNNWDLVDCSAEHILGAHWADTDARRLRSLARSSRVWDRRIAIMATFHDIKRGRFDRTLEVAEQLVHDPHDLIHKAVGWMLREIGHRDRRVECAFLDQHAAAMPRTMLRYAVEKFPAALRRRYLGA